MSNSNVKRVPQVDDKLWYGFISSLEAKTSTSGFADRENHSILVDDAEEETTMASIAPNDALKSISSDNEGNNVVVLSSDSENESEAVWSSNCKTKGYKRLWEKARQLIFHRLISNYSCTKNSAPEHDTEDPLFPYLKLQQLSEDLRNFQQDYTLNNVELTFLWENVIQWLIAIKLSSDPLDLNNEQFNLLLVDFMVQYVNYKTKLYCNIASNDKSQEKASQIMQTMSVIFNGNGSHILMTLLRIELKLEYRQILNPIFKKYLTDRSLCQTSSDFVVYLRIIFCFKRWKIITPVKSDRERINEIAVGKSMRYLRSEGGSAEVQDLTTDSILPKVVPKVNVQNVAFASISDLIGFARERKAIGTRILLVYTSLDLEDAIAKYFRLYERYIIRKAVCEDENVALCRAVSEMNAGGMQFLSSQAISPTSSRQEAKFGAALNLQKTPRSTLQVQPQLSKRQNRSARLGSSTSTHLATARDAHKNKLSPRFNSSIRNHNFNNLKSQSDISLSVKIDSLNHTVSSIDIDSTDDENENLDTRATNSRIPNPVDISNSTDCNTYNQKLIEQPIDRPTHTANLRVSDQNIETESLSVNTSSDDDASVGQVNTNASRNTKSPSIPKAQDEKPPETETCSQKFLTISSVATKPTRNEKNCIPGVVSSTSDFVKCNNKNVLDKIPESLEVHSAGTYTNAREVGTVKVVEQPMSPCQPVIVSGNYNPGSLVLGIDYSDVSSDNEDEDAQNGISMLSRGYWKVVEEATSSTSAAEVLSASVLTSLPVQSSKSDSDPFCDDMPTCSRYANTAALSEPSNELNKDKQMESSIAVDASKNVTDKSKVNATIHYNLETEKCSANQKFNESENPTANTQIQLSQNNFSEIYEKVGLDSSVNSLKQVVDVLNVSTEEPVKRNFSDLEKLNKIMNQESTIYEAPNTKKVSQGIIGVCSQEPNCDQVAEESTPQVEADNEESAEIEKLLRDIEDNLEKSEKNDVIVLTHTEKDNVMATTPLDVEASTDEPTNRETAPDPLRSNEMDKSSPLECEENPSNDDIGNTLKPESDSNNDDGGDNPTISNSEMTLQSDFKSADCSGVEVVASAQEICGNESELKTSVTYDSTAPVSLPEGKDFTDEDDSKKSISNTIAADDQETTPDSIDSNLTNSDTGELNNDERETNSNSEMDLVRKNEIFSPSAKDSEVENTAPLEFKESVENSSIAIAKSELPNDGETHNNSICPMESEEPICNEHEVLPNYGNVSNSEITTITKQNDGSLPLPQVVSSSEKQNVTELSNESHGITESSQIQDNSLEKDIVPSDSTIDNCKTERRKCTQTTKVEELTTAEELKGKEKLLKVKQIRSLKCGKSPEKESVEIACGSKELTASTNLMEDSTAINHIETVNEEPNQTTKSTGSQANIEAKVKLDESSKVGGNISDSEKETQGKELTEIKKDGNEESLKFKKSGKNFNYEMNPNKKAKVNRNSQTAVKPKIEQSEKKKGKLLQTTKKPDISNQPERTSIDMDQLVQSTKKESINEPPEDKEGKLFQSTKKFKITDQPEEKTSNDKDLLLKSAKKACLNEQEEEKGDKLLPLTNKSKISVQPEERTSNDKDQLLQSTKQESIKEHPEQKEGKLIELKKKPKICNLLESTSTKQESIKEQPEQKEGKLLQSTKKSVIPDQPDEKTSNEKDLLLKSAKKACINEQEEEKGDKLLPLTNKSKISVQPEERTSNDKDQLLQSTKQESIKEQPEQKERKLLQSTKKSVISDQPEEKTSNDEDLLRQSTKKACINEQEEEKADKLLPLTNKSKISIQPDERTSKDKDQLLQSTKQQSIKEQPEQKEGKLIELKKKPKISNLLESTSTDKDQLLQSTKQESIKEQLEQKEGKLLQSTKKSVISDQPEDLLRQSTKKACINEQEEEKADKLLPLTNKSKISIQPEERTSKDKDQLLQSTKQESIKEHPEQKEGKLIELKKKSKITDQPDEKTSNDKDLLLQSTEHACTNERSEEKKEKLLQSKKKTKVSVPPERISIDKDQLPKINSSFECNTVTLKEPEKKVLRATKKICSGLQMLNQESTFHKLDEGSVVKDATSSDNINDPVNENLSVEAEKNCQTSTNLVPESIDAFPSGSSVSILVSKESTQSVSPDIQTKANISVDEPIPIKRKRGKKKSSKLNISTPLTGAKDDENGLVKLLSNTSLKEIGLSIGNETELLENCERTAAKSLSEEDVEKRTPWKMRIKRRLSQCSDINKEFNIDIDENSRNDSTSSIYVAAQDCTPVAVKPLRSTTISIDADELALNFSKLDIKRNQNELEHKSDANHLISSACNKSNFEGRRKKQKIVKHVQEFPKPITDQVNALDQMPSDYNQEEILAVEALINMQVSSSNDAPRSTEVGDSNDTEVQPETTPILKSMLKGKNPKTRIEKQVRFAEEIHLKRLTAEKTMMNSMKFCNKLKTTRSSEGVLLIGGNKNMRKRLSEINARFNLELTSDTAESLDSISSSTNSGAKNFAEVSKEKLCFESASETSHPLTEEARLEKETKNCVREIIEINESSKVVGAQTIKRRRGRQKNIVRSTTNSEVLKSNLPIYPVLLTTRRQTLSSELIESIEADPVFFSDELLIAPTKVDCKKPSPHAEDSFNKPEVNVRNVNVEGANIRIKIKMPEPERADKFEVPLEAADEGLPSNRAKKCMDINEKEVLQEKIQPMQLKRVIIRLKRIKFPQNNPIAIGTKVLPEVSKSITPCKASIQMERAKGIEMRTSSGESIKCKTTKSELKRPKHDLVDKNPTENVTIKSELKPRKHYELIKPEPKKRKVRNEFILKPCDVILTEEIVNIRAKEITIEHNARHNSNLSEALVDLNTTTEQPKLNVKTKKSNSANETKKAKVNKMLQTIFKPKIVEQHENSSFEKDQLLPSTENANVSEPKTENDIHLESANKKAKVNEQPEKKSPDEKGQLLTLTKKSKIIDQPENPAINKDQLLKATKKTEVIEKLQKKLPVEKDKNLQSPNKPVNINKPDKKSSDEKDELIQSTKKPIVNEQAEKKPCDEMGELPQSIRKTKIIAQPEKPSSDKDQLIQSTNRTHISEKLEKQPTVEKDKQSSSKKASANEQPEEKPCNEIEKLHQSTKIVQPENVENKKPLQSKTETENAKKSKLEAEQPTTMNQTTNAGVAVAVQDNKPKTTFKSPKKKTDDPKSKGSPTDKAVQNNPKIPSIEVKQRGDVLNADQNSYSCEDIDFDDTANKITEGVIAELKLLSPENMLMQDSPGELGENDHTEKELKSKSNTMACEQKRLEAEDKQSNEQKMMDDEQNNAKLLDSVIEFSIDAILGKQNDKLTDKSKPVDQTISPTKARLGILTAERINNSIERSLEQKRTMSCGEASTPSENFSPKVSGESISCFKFATKNALKSSLNDVKINSNVPEVLLAGDDSENSNSGEAATGEEFILSLDDLLTKKDESPAQNDCEILANSMKTDKRQRPGTPNFAVELEIETSQASENSQPSISKVSSRTSSVDSDAQELHLTTQPTFSLASYDNPIDFNMTNGIPDFNDDVLDRMLFEQSIDCMISVEDYKQKCSQDNFASSKGGTISQTEKSKEHDTSATTSDICIPTILESKETTQIPANGSTVGIGQTNYLGSINTLDEVEASTTIEFDLNVTMEDLLGSNGDDLFAFSELEKSQSRINSFSNDSESGTPPLNETSIDVNESVASNTDSVAFDHSYNKDIKDLPKKKESIGKTIRLKRLPPNLVRTQSGPPQIESFNSPNKLKSHPAPYWKFKRNDEIKASTPQRKKPILCNEPFQDTICEPKQVDSSDVLDTVPPKVTCRDKLLCNMPDIEMGTTDSSRTFGLSIQSSTSKPTHCIQPAMIYKANKKAAPKNTVEITEIISIPPSAPAKITNVAEEDVPPAIDGSAQNLEVSTQAIDSTASPCPSTAIENSHIVSHTAPTITQAIIRIQSQTNRLERIDSVSELSLNYVSEPLCIQGTNETNTNYSTPPRGSTPTLDEHSKEGDDFSSESVTFVAPQLEPVFEPKRPSKRESSAHADVPPAKKAFVAETSEASNTSDRSSMIKRDQPQKKAATKSEKQSSPKDALCESPKKQSPEGTSANHENKPKSSPQNSKDPPHYKLENTDSSMHDTKKDIPESPKQTLPSLPTFSNIVEPTKTVNITTNARNLPEKRISVPAAIAEKNSNIIKKPLQVKPTEALSYKPKLEDSSSSRSPASEVDPHSVGNTAPSISSKYRKSHITSEAIAAAPGAPPAKQSFSSKLLKKDVMPVSGKVSENSVPPNPGTLNRIESQPPTTFKAHTLNSTNHYNAHPQKNKYVYQRTPDKLNAIKKPEPVKPAHRLQYNVSPIPAIDISSIKLTPEIEKTIEKQLEVYRRTLKNATSYMQHRENKQLMELQKKKLQLEFLEKEKRRQTHKLMTEAYKRKPNSESNEQKRKSNSESYQQQYRKFSMRESKPANEKPQTHSTPLTVPTAWEPKMPSTDEIIERLSKMKRS